MRESVIKRVRLTRLLGFCCVAPAIMNSARAVKEWPNWSTTLLFVFLALVFISLGIFQFWLARRILKWEREG